MTRRLGADVGRQILNLWPVILVVLGLGYIVRLSYRTTDMRIGIDASPHCATKGPVRRTILCI